LTGGESQRGVWEALQRKGEPSPLDDEPDEVHDHLLWVWRAFGHLTASRHIGTGAAGGIPFEAIDRYAARYEVDDFERFHSLIAAMDATYLRIVNKKNDPKKG